MSPGTEPLALMACKVVMRAGLPSSANAVASVLLDRYNWKSGRCDPGFASIAKLAGVSRSGVRKAIDALVGAKLIKVVTHGGGSGRNQYDFAWDEIRARDAAFQVAIGYAPNGARGMPQTGHGGVPQTGHQTRRTKPDEETRRPEGTPDSEAAPNKKLQAERGAFANGQRSMLLPFSRGKGLSRSDAAYNAIVLRLSAALRRDGLEAQTTPNQLHEAAEAEQATPGSGLRVLRAALRTAKLSSLRASA